MGSFNMVLCTDVILTEISQGFSQRDVALSYAMAIKSDRAGADKPDWKRINEAIVAQWSPAGLERVKALAWELLTEAS